jgi:hypothetical protein
MMDFSPQPLPPDVERFVRQFQLNLPTTPVRKAVGRRQAAVLIPIVCREQPTLLLTRRSDNLRKHAGQVAFPGGKADASDPSLIFTALREKRSPFPPLACAYWARCSRSTVAAGFR